jgi:DNA-binding SARP family transcriptional activator
LQDAFELLSARRYKHVEQFLQEQQEAAQRSGQMAVVVILAAAYQLCLTCRQFQADRELHQLGLEEAAHRERESRQQLRAVLTMLSQQTTAETQAKVKTDSDLPSTRSEISGSEKTEVDNQPAWLHKVKQLLGFQPTTPLDKSRAGADRVPEESTTSPHGRKELAAPLRHPDGEQEVQEEADTSPLSDPDLLQAVAALLTDSRRKEVADYISDDSLEPETSPAALAPDQVDEELLPVQERMPDDRQIKLRDSEQPGPYLLPPPPNIATSPAVDQPFFLPPVPEVELLGDTPEEAIPLPSFGLELPLVAPDEETSPESASLVIYCLGPFRVYQNNELITEWSGFMGQKILKYIVAHRVKPVAKEVLMDVMWADVGQEAARRNLHQAIYSLRQTLRRREPNLQHILFENDHYLLNPATGLWIDFLEFEKYAQDGQRLDEAGETEKAIEVYGVAEGLYQGTFFEEDLYEEWTNSQRDYLLNLYLEITSRLSEHFRKRRNNVAAIALCQKVLGYEPCFEPAHRHLMQCYLAQGQRHLAMRQYQTCVQVMKDELNLNPSEETETLFQRITA